MPTYNDLRPDDDLKKKKHALVFPDMSSEEKKRTIERLLDLRAGLEQKITAKRADQNLLIASWNIKEFGHTTQRLPEAYFYAAEILSRFDLIVIQEVKSALQDLYIVMQILGDDWSYLVNDITEGKDGNRERSAYVFNKKRVGFAGLAGEIVLWGDLTQNSPIKQFKRTPYMTGFEAGWKNFALICVHLQPGDGDDNVKHRQTEIELLVETLKVKRQRDHLWTENLILAGDFNFYTGPTKDDGNVQTIIDGGYREVEGLKGLDTNASQTETYDRLFIGEAEYFTVAKNANGVENGGVFNPFDYVYRFGDEPVYEQAMKDVYTGDGDLDDANQRNYYFKHYWRKNQLSDHFPIWFELIIDSSDDFLQEKLASYT